MSNKQQKLTKANLLESTPESSESEEAPAPVVVKQSKNVVPQNKPVQAKTAQVSDKKPQTQKSEAPKAETTKVVQKSENKPKEVPRKESSNSNKQESAPVQQKQVQQESSKKSKKDGKKEETQTEMNGKSKTAHKEVKPAVEEEAKLGKRENAPKVAQPVPKKQAAPKFVEPSSSESSESEEEKVVVQKKTEKKEVPKKAPETKVSQKKPDASPISSKKVSFHVVEEPVVENKNKKVKTSAVVTENKQTKATPAPVQTKNNQTSAKQAPAPVQNAKKQEANPKLAKMQQALKKPVESESEEEESEEQEEVEEEEMEVEENENSDEMEVEEQESESEEEIVQPVVTKSQRKASAEKQVAQRKASVEKPVAQRKASAEKPVAQRKQSAEKQQNNYSKPQEHGQVQYPNNQNNGNNSRFGPEFEVIVAGLPFTSTENDIKNHFSQCPDLKFVKVVMGQDGRPRGKAFVKFTTENGMNQALELNNSNLGGRNIIVELTEKMRGGQSNQGGQQNQGGNQSNGNFDNSTESMSILVRNLAFTVDETKLQSVFSGCGTIKGVRICKDETGRSKGFGFIDFTSIDSAKMGIKKTNDKIDGRAITVVFSVPRDRNAPRPSNGGFGNRSNSGPRQFGAEKKGMLTQFGGETVDLD